jgi:ribosomal subunit interface protein
MPLQLTGRHMTVTDEHKEYIEKKVERLRRLCQKIDELSVTLTKDKLLVQGDATFRAGKISVKARETGSQTLEVIDILVDNLEAQISKAKKKMADHKAPNLDRNIGLAGDTEEPVSDEEMLEA